MVEEEKLTVRAHLIPGREFGCRIDFVKYIREYFGWGLKESKELMESIFEPRYLDFQVPKKDVKEFITRVDFCDLKCEVLEGPGQRKSEPTNEVDKSG